MAAVSTLGWQYARGASVISVELASLLVAGLGECAWVLAVSLGVPWLAGGKTMVTRRAADVAGQAEAGDAELGRIGVGQGSAGVVNRCPARG
jgi:hypothetical protein